MSFEQSKTQNSEIVILIIELGSEILKSVFQKLKTQNIRKYPFNNRGLK